MQRKLVIGFWISFAAAAAVYAVMVGWSLPKISAAAGGLAPFDMRPAGYSLAVATAFLTALSEDGRTFYLSTQHRLDTVYPPLLALTLALGLWVMSPTHRRTVRLPLIAVPVLGMLADLSENVLVASLLNAPADALDSGLVRIASGMTVIKSVLTTVAMSALLLLTVLWGWRKRRGL